MELMLLLLLESLVAAILAGSLCGYLGVYLKRLRLITLGFAVAHGAIAGASIAFMLQINIEITAFIAGIIVAFFIEILYKRFEIERDLASMYVFSISSALAIIAIYSSPTLLLTSDIATLILWGSILSMTLDKIIFLAVILIILILYTHAYRIDVNSLLFDQKLAEAEGVNTEYHAAILVLISSASIAILLKFVGGLLLFSLIFGPAIAATVISHKRQGLIGLLIGSVSCSIGVLISFYLDLPIGSTIALSSGIISAVISILATLFEKRRIIRSIYRDNREAK
ncbi:MAG: metal ABC transporter permease [Candidatus Njordarchaeota archaeon]